MDIPSVAQKFINGYTTFLNILDAGEAPISFPPYIAGGAGTALSKKGGRVRPIVDGEGFRRHISFKRMLFEITKRNSKSL